ncbi:3-phosphoshikimate 1-carboxyvinyltransferase [Aminipila luticellarii]|uniref:3-phosphoshikimate 1-carboxyvinyltransferase n=1 Tax=Aminipila luticellarii TaxID=2507160 RepID=A0A410PS90_9FIRM|nr:3-phosphoshikimate 1-carboxyvinyltransferase [Aminipila luticellarii]QAT41794.1 3-phosphoshikimate 1-carboxyvinyltransferase [Aminipila luticellarii]
MNIQITPKPLKGRIPSISSKSHAHRLMIAASLCEEPCQVHISDMNQDLEATQNCLMQLSDESPVLDCHESGSTLRFLLPIAMALKNQASFFGSGRLPERPLSPLKEELEAHGCTFTTETDISFPPFDGSTLIYTGTGRLKGGAFQLPGNVSSQYITGLLFALPLLKEDSSITLTSKLESSGYVRLTLEVLECFGIRIRQEFSKNPKREQETLYSFVIKGNQKYKSPGEVTAEGDWSNGAFWIVADALSSFSQRTSEPSVSCLNLNKNSAQGDKAILSFVRAVRQTKKSKEKLVFDASEVPDLVPILAVLAASREGITEITHAGRLRIKESDRLATVHELIGSLGGDITELPEGLVINGTGKLRGGTVNGHNDHRIVMSAAIASILCTEPVIILGAEAADKSYPKFFEDFTRLGGEFHVL